MVVGMALFAFTRTRRKGNSVNARGGSVAVGGNNSGTITNINHVSEGSHTITIISIIVELVGIGVVIWHAMHLVIK